MELRDWKSVAIIDLVDISRHIVIYNYIILCKTKK